MLSLPLALSKKQGKQDVIDKWEIKNHESIMIVGRTSEYIGCEYLDCKHVLKFIRNVDVSINSCFQE